jgi:alanyl-tRNA synthetase
VTKRLYYDHPDLLEFDSVIETAESAPSASASEPSRSAARPAIILRETAFYPTSGGQVHDTGSITLASGEKLRVSDVADTEDGRVIHYLEAPLKPELIGVPVHGSIDADRRRDHMQQHTGQHVLSAAFIELLQFPTVSFHMGEDYCSIDLAVPTLTPDQVIAAEKRANEIVFENRPVTIRYVHRDQAEKLGLRKLPPAERDQLRLIEVANFDLSACGGTHVNSTGQIGSILLRKTEKTRQGMRVEFVCGDRAVRVARRDYSTLTEAAALYSAQLVDVPEMIRKSFNEAKTLRRQKEDALEELASAMAQAELSRADIPVRAAGSTESAVRPEDKSGGRPTVIVRSFSDRDTAFAKLFAQKLTRPGNSVIALVASTLHPAGLVFAQSSGGTADMGSLLKQVLSSVGGRGGGSRDFAQGGVPAASDVEQLLRQAAGTIKA